MSVLVNDGRHDVPLKRPMYEVCDHLTKKLFGRSAIATISDWLANKFSRQVQRLCTSPYWPTGVVRMGSGNTRLWTLV